MQRAPGGTGAPCPGKIVSSTFTAGVGESAKVAHSRPSLESSYYSNAAYASWNTPHEFRGPKYFHTFLRPDNLLGTSLLYILKLETKGCKTCISQ